MPAQAQQIAAVINRIKPVQVIPEQDVLLVVPAKSSTIQYVLAKLVPGSAEIPGVVGNGNVLDASGKIVTPAVAGSPTIPAVPDSYIQVDSGTIEMDEAAWAAWKNQDDDSYRSDYAAKRLGLTIL